MLDDAAKLLLRAGQKSGHVLERDERDVKRVAETNEARALHRRIDIEHACKKCRLIGDDPDGAAIEPRESHHEILRKVLMNLEEFALIDDFVNRILHVIGLLRI